MSVAFLAQFIISNMPEKFRLLTNLLRKERATILIIEVAAPSRLENAVRAPDQSGGGPPHSTTLARYPGLHESREAF